jgi:hypothetical protein
MKHIVLQSLTALKWLIILLGIPRCSSKILKIFDLTHRGLLPLDTGAKIAPHVTASCV